jgi:hypothetical protein
LDASDAAAVKAALQTAAQAPAIPPFTYVEASVPAGSTCKVGALPQYAYRLNPPPYPMGSRVSHLAYLLDLAATHLPITAPNTPARRASTAGMIRSEPWLKFSKSVQVESLRRLRFGGVRLALIADSKLMPAMKPAAPPTNAPMMHPSRRRRFL